MSHADTHTLSHQLTRTHIANNNTHTHPCNNAQTHTLTDTQSHRHMRVSMRAIFCERGGERESVGGKSERDRERKKERDDTHFRTYACTFACSHTKRCTSKRTCLCARAHSLTHTREHENTYARARRCHDRSCICVGSVVSLPRSLSLSLSMSLSISMSLSLSIFVGCA